MASEPVALDVTDMPELLRVAEEVNATGEPRILRSKNRDIALVTPIAGTESGRKRTRFPPEDEGDRWRPLVLLRAVGKMSTPTSCIEYIYEGRQLLKTTCT